MKGHRQNISMHVPIIMRNEIVSVGSKNVTITINFCTVFKAKREFRGISIALNIVARPRITADRKMHCDKERRLSVNRECNTYPVISRLCAVAGLASCPRDAIFFNYHHSLGDIVVSRRVATFPR